MSKSPTHHPLADPAERPTAAVAATPPAPPASGPTVAPPSKHELALMIWLAVFPTLTVLNLTLKPWLFTMGPTLRTFVLATIAVPIVIYGLMPQLHKVRVRLLGCGRERPARVAAGARWAGAGDWCGAAG